MANKAEAAVQYLSISPGPWEFVIEGGWPIIYSSAADPEDGHPLPVVDLHHGGYDYSDLGFSLHANGRLMAAAPELLAELIDLRKRFHAACRATGSDEEFVIGSTPGADAAISKATGEA